MQLVQLVQRALLALLGLDLLALQVQPALPVHDNMFLILHQVHQLLVINGLIPLMEDSMSIMMDFGLKLEHLFKAPLALLVLLDPLVRPAQLVLPVPLVRLGSLALLVQLALLVPLDRPVRHQM